jgi:PIN domain nuclease of toxin-antitoxin system
LSLLLDTNVLIFLYEESPQLSLKAKRRLIEGDELIFISVISAWEYNQKRKKNPGLLPVSFEQLIAQIPYQPLDFAYDLNVYAESLPLIHRDPFDRMLIAQALYYDFTLVTADKEMARYPVKTLW